MKIRLPSNELMFQATVSLILLLILMALDDILYLLRSRPYVSMEFVPPAKEPEPITIDAVATETKPRSENGRFVKKNPPQEN